MLTIREDSLADPQSRDLIALHQAGMDAMVPPGALVLDLSDLRRPGVTVWSAWDGPRIAGIGALKTLPDGRGEIKSMRTHPDFVGRGAGSLILVTIIDAARARGLRRLSLETGSGPAFAAARALYDKFGFREGEAYAGHRRSDANRFLHLGLDGAGGPPKGHEDPRRDTAARTDPEPCGPAALTRPSLDP